MILRVIFGLLDECSTKWQALNLLLEQNNMHDLFKKVSKGLYPAIPGIYSKDLAKIIGLMLNVSSKNRPTADEILEMDIIKQKIERVKELLVYNELNLNEIADRLGYSSVQHLSAQFKKVTGATPSTFKKLQSPESLRKSLDAL